MYLIQKKNFIVGVKLHNPRQQPSQQQQQQQQQQQDHHHQQQQQQQQQQLMMRPHQQISIKQEHGCPIVAPIPGQTQLGSPLNGSERISGDIASSGFVDSTTYPSRPTPPTITGNELFALQEELLNGNNYLNHF